MIKARKSQRGTALVTGAAKRIGQAIALMLAENGFDIAVHYQHSRNDAEATAKLIRKKGVRCELFACDLNNEAQTLSLIRDVHLKFSNLNLLINCASIFEKSKFTTADLSLFDRHFAVNLKAPFILSCEFRTVCHHGQIINFLDTDIVENKTDHVAYLLTKKALVEMTKMAAVHFAPDIRVNAIAPGLILPPKGQTDEYLNRRAQGIPLKRKGDVVSICKSVKFLIDNDYLTGQIIFNDGGEHLV